jgi:hypothetical protein
MFYMSIAIDGTPRVMRKKALKAGWMKPRMVLTTVNTNTWNR